MVELVEAIEQELWDMLYAGGGDKSTVRAKAEEIAKMAGGVPLDACAIAQLKAVEDKAAETLWVGAPLLKGLAVMLRNPPLGGNGPGRQSDHMGDVYGTPDREIAIGEHAFGAGWDAAVAWCYGRINVGDGAAAKQAAWSAYDPPEELCGGAKEEANV